MTKAKHTEEPKGRRVVRCRECGKAGRGNHGKYRVISVHWFQGEVTGRILCEVCGHTWGSYGTIDHLPGYEEANEADLQKTLEQEA